MQNDTLPLNSALDGVGGQRLALATLLRERPGTPGRTSAPVWTGTQNLATTGIRSRNRLAHSKCNFYSMYIIYKCDLGPRNTIWRDACGPRTKGWRTMS
jgi:hypothetical protein